MKKDLITIRGITKTSIFFRKRDYHPDIEQIKELLKRASFKNHCTGADLSRFDHGEIVVHYSPLYHPFFRRFTTERKLKDYIKSTAWGQ